MGEEYLPGFHNELIDERFFCGGFMKKLANFWNIFINISAYWGVK